MASFFNTVLKNGIILQHCQRLNGPASKEQITGELLTYSGQLAIVLAPQFICPL